MPTMGQPYTDHTPTPPPIPPYARALRPVALEGLGFARKETSDFLTGKGGAAAYP